MMSAMYWVKFRKNISATEHKDYEEEVTAAKLVELLSHDNITIFALRLVDYATHEGLFRNV